MSKILAKKVKEFRISRNLTQSVLAKRVGVDDSMITKIEKGKTLGSITMLNRLAAALGVRLVDLLDD